MTFEKVAKIIAENRDMDEKEVKITSSFTDLGFDSLDTVELVMSLEDEFNISIESAENIKTVEDAVGLIDSLIKES